MLITADEIIDCGPCSDYPHDLIRSLVGEGKTPQEIADSGHRQVFWALTNVLARRDRATLISWLWQCLGDPDVLAAVPSYAKPAWDEMVAAPGNAPLAYKAADAAAAYAYASYAAYYAANAAEAVTATSDAVESTHDANVAAADAASYAASVAYYANLAAGNSAARPRQLSALVAAFRGL